MMHEDKWGTHDDWHELLDAICLDRGHMDNMRLATELCVMAGSSSQVAFETALKNLRNWRHASHVPQRRNFLLLTKALGIAQDEKLREHWNRLYLEARKPAEIEREPVGNGSLLMQWALAAALTSIVALSGTVIYLVASNTDKTNIGYHPSVSLKVGDLKMIHGRRGACGELPPTWEVTRHELPELDIGTWSDGGIGMRFSRSCDGPTPARGVIFTATASGTAEFNLYGDPMSIRVD